MLGAVEHGDVDALLAALQAQDGAALIAAIEHLAGFAPDFSAVLESLAAALHRVQLRQLVPAAAQAEDSPTLRGAADAVAPELIQLWYQMALSGRRELPLAPSPRVGFEMILLRMLAFMPVAAGGESGVAKPAGSSRAAASAAAALLDQAPARSPASAIEAAAPITVARGEPILVAPAEPAAMDLEPREPASRPPLPSSARPPMTPRAAEPAVSPHPDVASTANQRTIHDNAEWLDLIAALGLRGPVRELAANAGFVSHRNGVLRLALPEAQEPLRMLLPQLAAALAEPLGAAPRIEFETAVVAGETLRDRDRRERDERQLAAEAAFQADPNVQRLIQQYGARIVPDSIRPAE